MNFKLISQWVAIGITLLGFFLIQDRRLTAVEIGLQQEMKGYTIMFENITKQINSAESRLTVRLERIEDRLDRGPK